MINKGHVSIFRHMKTNICSMNANVLTNNYYSTRYVDDFAALGSQQALIGGDSYGNYESAASDKTLRKDDTSYTQTPSSDANSSVVNFD